MENILLLTGFFPNEIRNEIINKSKFNIQFAADTLQNALVDGLSFFYKDLYILNFPFIGAFPTRSRIKKVKSFKLKNGLNIGYINIPIIKNFFIYIKAKTYIRKWIFEVSGSKTIIIYSQYLPFLKAATVLKQKYNNFNICLISPDLPEFMNPPKNIFYSWVKSYLNLSISKTYEYVDSYVFISKYMSEKIPVLYKKWTVIEGVYKEYINNDINSIIIPNEKYILYSGNLAKRYGILELVEAFQLINISGFNLVICGDGDAKEDVVAASKSNNRITYLGTLDGNKVRSLQRHATLLINPRRATGEYTKYSFPSKILEYFGSGTPTLMYKLPGIPDEYYDYCFTFENNSTIEEISNKILEILRLDNDYMTNIGNRAKEFVNRYKNSKSQALKIVNIIESNVK